MQNKLKEIQSQIVFGTPINYSTQTRSTYSNAQTGVYGFKVSPPKGKTSIRVPSTFAAPGGFAYSLEDKKFLPDNGIGFGHVCTSTCTYYIYSPFSPMIRYDQ